MSCNKVIGTGIGVREVSPAVGLWACLCPNFIDAILKSQNTLIWSLPPKKQNKKKQGARDDAQEITAF